MRRFSRFSSKRTVNLSPWPHLSSCALFTFKKIHVSDLVSALCFLVEQPAALLPRPDLAEFSALCRSVSERIQLLGYIERSPALCFVSFAPRALIIGQGCAHARRFEIPYSGRVKPRLSLVECSISHFPACVKRFFELSENFFLLPFFFPLFLSFKALSHTFPLVSSGFFVFAKIFFACFFLPPFPVIVEGSISYFPACVKRFFAIAEKFFGKLSRLAFVLFGKGRAARPDFVNCLNLFNNC